MCKHLCCLPPCLFIEKQSMLKALAMCKLRVTLAMCKLGVTLAMCKRLCCLPPSLSFPLLAYSQSNKYSC